MNDFIAHNQDDTIRFIFSSTLTNVDDAINRLKYFLDLHSFPYDSFELVYITREALNNAVIHGNKRKSELKVEFSLCFRDNHIEMKIIDEGSGFNWRDQLAKNSASHEATSGRGLRSIARYGYSIRFNETGNIIYISK